MAGSGLRVHLPAARGPLRSPTSMTALQRMPSPAWPWETLSAARFSPAVVSKLPPSASALACSNTLHPSIVKKPKENFPTAVLLPSAHGGGELFCSFSACKTSQGACLIASKHRSTSSTSRSRCILSQPQSCSSDAHRQRGRAGQQEAEAGPDRGRLRAAALATALPQRLAEGRHTSAGCCHISARDPRCWKA